MLEKITNKNCELFEELAQDYEEEFSSITKKQRQADGRYKIDVDWHSLNAGFYWKKHGRVVGFVIKDQSEQCADIGEFNIIPSHRRCGAGKRMAFAIFNAFPGPWQVRQIQGADAARHFWLRAITEYTQETYTELILVDPIWGKVTCQRFLSAPCKSL